MQIQLYLDAWSSEYIGPTQNNHENLIFQNYYISKETCLQIFDQSPESGSCWLHFQGDSEVFSCREIYAKYLFFFLFDIISMRMPADAGCVVLENCVSF